jgi:hypothetical protein
MDVSGAVNTAPLWGREIQLWLEVKLSTREPFDDQHGGGAGGTTQQVRCFGAICAFHCAEQLAATCEGGFPSSVGEETEVTDADQSFGQNVKKKSAQELICGNCHDLLLAAMGIVSPTESDAIVLKGHETMVGDGYAMGVARQVVENMFGTAEGWLGVNDPVLLAELPEEVAEGVR